MMPVSNAKELGAAIRANRRALGVTLSDLATRLGYRRQTIADLEAGKNVKLYLVLAVLSALDKGLVVANKSRPEYEMLAEIFREPEE